MELLLNLVWLLLAMPAYWLWRDSRTVAARRKSTAFQCLLALGCALVILFPVVSATDDLHAMRAEMEESPSSKRSVAHADSDKSSSSRSHVQPALSVASVSFVRCDTAWYQAPAGPAWIAPTQRIVSGTRAPPSSLLS